MYQILEQIQTDVYTIGDTYTKVRVRLVCDALSDLPGIHDISGLELQMGSTAHIVQTAQNMMMQSNGTWSEQTTNSIASLVTSISNLESEMSGVHSDIDILVNLVGELRAAAVLLVDNGAKNIADGRHADTTTGGIVFDFADDGTCTTTGTATSAIMLTVCTFTPKAGVTYVASGCPTGGNNNTYALRVTTAADSTVVWETGSGMSFIPTTNDPLTIKFSIKSGTVCDGLVFKPMITPADFWKISENYVPYSPTNAELYALIKSYHP